MITFFNTTPVYEGNRVNEVKINVDSNAYPLQLVIKCFKTQPPPPRFEPCFQLDRVNVTPTTVGFITGPNFNQTRAFTLNQIITIEHLSSISIVLSAGAARRPGENE